MSVQKNTEEEMGNGEDANKLVKKESLTEAMARMKKNMAAASSTAELQDAIPNDYQEAEDSQGVVRRKTGIVFHDVMALHKCEWDENHPENPQRYFTIMCRFYQLGLIGRCERIAESREVLSSIDRVHSVNKLALLTELSKMNMPFLKKEAAKYDAIYFNKETAAAARTGLCLVYAMVKAVVLGKVQNGIAVVRPPGHHAMRDEYCGYCYINNVAVTARAVLDKTNFGIKKILILDFDVHHGQATQQMFYDTNEVLYISIHRYENGRFWPNLRQSNYDYIGKPNSPGYGYNVNIPLNVTGCGDTEYMAIFTNIVMPLAFEFQPDLVIFSAGYDACIGCPEGEMMVTPYFYGHMIKLLSGMANGMLAVVLEGGYYLPSLAEGVSLSLKGLLDDPTGLLEPLGLPNESVRNTINNVMGMLHPLWKCFSHLLRPPSQNDPAHIMHIRHEKAAALPPYEVENCYPVQTVEKLNHFDEIMDDLKCRTPKLSSLRVGYVYSEAMLDHKPDDTCADHPERPERLRAVYELFQQFQLHKRCQLIEHSKANVVQLSMAHDDTFLTKLNRWPKPRVADLCTSASAGDYAAGSQQSLVLDVYSSNGCRNAALHAAGSLLHLCQAVMNRKVSSGLALVRPPGHHAERDFAGGFCFLNNIVIAAKWIKNQYPDQRIMIVDFDIHHGNGTQHAFYGDNDVLFMSIHKFDKGNFYPGLDDADASFTGEGDGMGFNVNIPFKNGKMGDADYAAIFHSIVLPIGYSFAPTVVLVSAGFDAGINDLLGNYSVTPQAFGHFIQLLRPLANGRIILTMEGGYNIYTLKYGMIMCAKALLGDPLPRLKFAETSASAKNTIQEVIQIQRQFWPVLEVIRPLSSTVQSIYLNNGRDQALIEGVATVPALNLSMINREMFPREFENVPAYN